MAEQSLPTLLDRLRRIVGPPGTGGLTDAELLERCVRPRDEAAFEVLVWRHGAMVLGVCRRLLRHEQDAEDAFQATFLAFVRKGGAVGKREALASWLYKVAYGVALRAKHEAAKRARRERSGVAAEVTAPPGDPGRHELRVVLDEEISRLPERYRAAFVLCQVEGHTDEEAARQLGCPRGTVSSRLTWALDRLWTRLTRRGLAFSAGWLVIRTMRVIQLKIAAAVVLVFALQAGQGDLPRRGQRAPGGSQ
jgi:RNA polymerase sigma factor (sigma-70 family)